MAGSLSKPNGLRNSFNEVITECTLNSPQTYIFCIKTEYKVYKILLLTPFHLLYT